MNLIEQKRIIQTAIDGKEIEVYVYDEQDTTWKWIDFDYPARSFNFEVTNYRIKPEIKMPELGSKWRFKVDGVGCIILKTCPVEKLIWTFGVPQANGWELADFHQYWEEINES